MANVEINTREEVRTMGEYAITYQTNGYGGCTPIINGEEVPALRFGYVSESDKVACINLIEDAIRATNGDIYYAIQYIQNAMQVAAADIKPSEAVEVNGIELLIDYNAQAIYLGTEELANLADIQSTMTDEVAKALLMERARVELDAREYYEDEDEDYYL